MKHGYKHQVEDLSVPDRAGADMHPTEPLVCTHYHHDELMLAAERIRNSAGLDPVSAAATATSLKLLGSVMLSEKNNPLFDCLRHPMREFILSLTSLGTRADDQ